ncbi:MAG: hypothetical protein ACXACA_03120 [Candidatus Ranarchaeia archaeon]|jgi:hypothetical protein
MKFNPRTITILILAFGISFFALAMYLNQTDFVISLLRVLDFAGAAGKP